jgi:hypothetical protein
MKKYFIVLFLLALAIFVSGCIGFLTTPGEDEITLGKGRLEIYLTDSSGDYKAGDDENYLEVNITISKIEAHIAGLELEPNKYTQIRLFVSKSTISVEIEVAEEENDKEIDVVNEVPFEIFNVEIPSAYQTGIKLIHPFEIIEGEIIKLTIDFDAEKSVVKAGNGEYKLKPVIKVTSGTYFEEDIDTGSVFGIVYYDGGDSGLTGIGDASASFTLYGGEYIFTTSTVTDQDGLFFIEQLPVGTYTLTTSAIGYENYTAGGIVVTEGETTNINIELKTELLD